jgi:FkbM family methyltransferase
MLNFKKFSLILRIFALGKYSKEYVEFLVFLLKFLPNNYSSDFQDIFVCWYLAKSNKSFSDLFFFDIGACDGISKSNTYLIELQGATGILIEPNWHFFDQLKRDRVSIIELVGLVIDQNSDKFSLFFDHKYSQQAKLLLSTSQVNQSSIEVKILTVKEIFEKYKDNFRNKILYVSIDVEGNDLLILKNIFQIGILPDIITIEHNHQKLVKNALKKLGKNYGYKICFNNFFRNEFALVRVQ